MWHTDLAICLRGSHHFACLGWTYPRSRPQSQKIHRWAFIPQLEPMPCGSFCCSESLGDANKCGNHTLSWPCEHIYVPIDYLQAQPTHFGRPQYGQFIADPYI